MKSSTNQLKNRVFIYSLERNNIPFYIGKTKNPKSRKADWLREYKDSISFNIIDEVNNQNWKFWECYWIEQLKCWGFDLVNKNKGGGGLEKHSDEVIELIRKQKIGKKQNRTKVRKDKGTKRVKKSGIKIGSPKGWKMSEKVRKTKNQKQIGKPKHTIETKIKFADPTIYKFYNVETQEIFEGIRYDFQNKYNLKYKGIYNLIKGKAKTYKKWKIKLKN